LEAVCLGARQGVAMIVKRLSPAQATTTEGALGMSESTANTNMQLPAESLSGTSVRDKVVTAAEAVRLIRDSDSVVV
jgi:hypothetical protein